jgi:iron complex outermembrane receptor protein
LGLVWSFAEEYSFTASLSRTERLPSATELFADGPHVATRAFEIGDPDLDPEESLGFDVSLKSTSERVGGALNLFVNRFDGFIDEDFTGLEEDGLTVVRFVQRDAELVGAEVDLLWRLAEVGGGHLDLRTRADWVRAELDDGSPLPRIPPLRFGLGLSFHQGPWQATAEARRVEEQDRVAPQETPTGGHTLVNASVGYRIFSSKVVTDLLLRGTNLTDQVARNHVSFLKDDVPLPGRDLSLSVRLTF